MTDRKGRTIIRLTEQFQELRVNRTIDARRSEVHNSKIGKFFYDIPPKPIGDDTRAIASKSGLLLLTRKCGTPLPSTG